MDNTIYKVIKTISFLIRYGLCCITIEQVLLFESETAQWLWSLIFGGALYTVLRFFCYAIVGCIVKHFPAVSSSEKALMYFFLYIIVVFIIFGILKILTYFGALPIGVEFTLHFKEWIANKIDSLWQLFSDWLIHFTNNASNSAI